eukprot:224541-Amorphochlora_amoeboformis.AAC.1
MGKIYRCHKCEKVTIATIVSEWIIGNQRATKMWIFFMRPDAFHPRVKAGTISNGLGFVGGETW